jgi:hypothetical protein
MGAQPQYVSGGTRAIPIVSEPIEYADSLSSYTQVSKVGFVLVEAYVVTG